MTDTIKAYGKDYEIYSMKEWSNDSNASLCKAAFILVEKYKESITDEIIRLRVELSTRISKVSGVMIDPDRYSKLREDLKGISNITDEDGMPTYLYMRTPFESLKVYRGTGHFFEGVKFLL